MARARRWVEKNGGGRRASADELVGGMGKNGGDVHSSGTYPGPRGLSDWVWDPVHRLRHEKRVNKHAYTHVSLLTSRSLFP